MDMKYLVRSWALLCAVVLCLTACGSSDDDGAPVADVETMQLIISVPATSAGTRMGDPGAAVDEGEDWDRADWDQLAVILAYTDNSQVTLPGGSRVLVKTLSKSEFGKLRKYNGNPNYRMFSVDAQPGKVYVYGVTYSANAENGPAKAIARCTTNADVQALALSNYYTKGSDDGSVDYAKFVSVATGYYKGEGSTPATLEIKEGGTGEIGSIPTMTLTRLAAKIDIQWDAADAYEAGYTGVGVTGFTYNGGEEGRLFPELSPASTTATKPWTFYNTSEISQRNGRVYHYTFPDGTTPSVTFNISAKKTGVSPDPSVNYTLKFPSALQKATWYKVNATIKGITGSGIITLSMDNNTGVQTGG